MKKVLPKVKKIINMSLKQAKYYGDNENLLKKKMILLYLR